MENLLQKYLGTRFSFYAIGGLLVLLAVVWGAGKWHIHSLQTALANCNASLATTKAAITVQNAAVDHLAADGKLVEATANDRASRILLEDLPPAAGTGFQAMNLFLESEFRHAK